MYNDIWRDMWCYFMIYGAFCGIFLSVKPWGLGSVLLWGHWFIWWWYDGHQGTNGKKEHNQTLYIKGVQNWVRISDELKVSICFCYGWFSLTPVFWVQKHGWNIWTKNPSDQDFYVKKIAEGVATLAASVYPKRIIVRLSDFKSNEQPGNPSSKSGAGAQQREKTWVQ